MSSLFHISVASLPFKPGREETVKQQEWIIDSVRDAFGAYGGELISTWEVFWGEWPLWLFEIRIDSLLIFERNILIAEVFNTSIDNDYGSTIVVGVEYLPDGGAILRFVMSPWPF